jgi:carboxymethylenebutenolidase
VDSFLAEVTFAKGVSMPGQMVSFQSNGGQAEGYLAIPQSGRGPGVVVIQEWWGLVPHIKDVADRFAGEGYTALAPDIYHGKTKTEPDDAAKLMMAMNIEQAATDLGGAYDYMRSHDATTDKLGTVGFSMGGGLALYTATLRPVDACVIYYGVLPPVAQPDLSKLAGPVIGHYGEEDEFVPPTAAQELENRIHAAGRHALFYFYEGVGHALFNDTRPEAYDEEAAATSWARTLAFYRQHLW